MFWSTRVFALALLALAGCNSYEDSTDTVSGRVRFRGAPLAGGTIVFAPDPERGGDGPIAWGEIGPDGRYALRTKTGASVSPGWHRVTFAATTGRDLPARYSDPARSGQTCEVKAGQANQIDFDLK
jgi:hypothetical protein